MLSTTGSTLSKSICLLTGSKYSHAMLYTDPIIIHADNGGVFTSNPQRHFFHKNQVLVLRHTHSSDAYATAICSYATALSGTLYSVPEAIASRLLSFSKLKALSAAQFCSRLVAQAYQDAGLKIVNNPDYCMPKDIFNAVPTSLAIVENGIRPISQADIEIASTPDTIKIHQKRVFSWLKVARRLAKKKDVSVHSIIDAYRFAETHIIQDRLIAKAIKNSGYLEGHYLDKLANPYRYDQQKFREKSQNYGIGRFIESEILSNKHLLQDVISNIKFFKKLKSNSATLTLHMHQERAIFYANRLEIPRNICSQSGLATELTEINKLIAHFQRLGGTLNYEK